MPLELQIIRACEFVRVGADGHLDLAASREILKLMARACGLRGINEALLDLRDVQPGPVPMLTSEELASLVNTFHENGFSNQQRLAVLYSADPHGGARKFAFLSTLQGWNVRAFDNFEEALLWLSQGQSERAKKESEGQAIPVQFKKTPDDPKSTRSGSSD